jgi:hypothetical protein
VSAGVIRGSEFVETDDGKRGASGVVISLVERKPGELRLVLDDVKNGSGSGNGPWHHHALFTFKGYSEKDISDLDLSEKELASIGFNVLARLGALRERPIK